MFFDGSLPLTMYCQPTAAVAVALCGCAAFRSVPSQDGSVPCCSTSTVLVPNVNANGLLPCSLDINLQFAEWERDLAALINGR